MQSRYIATASQQTTVNEARPRTNRGSSGGQGGYRGRWGYGGGKRD